MIKLKALKELHQIPVECPACHGIAPSPRTVLFSTVADECSTCGGYGKVLKIVTVEYKEFGHA